MVSLHLLHTLKTSTLHQLPPRVSAPQLLLVLRMSSGTPIPRRWFSEPEVGETLGDGKTETHSSPICRTEEQNDPIQTAGSAAGGQIMGCPRDGGTASPTWNQ